MWSDLMYSRHHCSSLDTISGNYVFWLQILEVKKEGADEGAEVTGKNSLTDRWQSVCGRHSYVAYLPVILDQIVDSCHSSALSGLCEAPVTLKRFDAWAGRCRPASSCGTTSGHRQDNLVLCHLSLYPICVCSPPNFRSLTSDVIMSHVLHSDYCTNAVCVCF